MNKLYEKVMELEDFTVTQKIEEAEKIKEVVLKMVTELEPEMNIICDKLGIFDRVNFKKSVCSNLVNQIKLDAEYVSDKNKDKEIVASQLEISKKIELLRDIKL